MKPARLVDHDGTLPWRDWFVFAVTKLGLRPGDFWALSIEEWIWLLQAQSQDRLAKRELLKLKEKFPDGANGQ